jgi:hypothetical protein
VTEDALGLAFRTGLPYVGLRDHAHDPDLDRLIPPDAARTARAVPLAADDDHIRLAVADPDPDLSTLDPYVTGRQVELALAPREELDAILGPAPEPQTPQPAAADELGEAAAEPQSDPLTPPPAAEPESERLAAEDAASTEPTPPEPEPLIAGPGPEQGAEHGPLVGEEAAPLVAGQGPEQGAEPDSVVAERDPAAAESEPVAAGEPDPIAAAEPDQVAEREPAAAEPEPAAAAEPEPVAAAEPDPAASPGTDLDAELAGAVPSWLEPPRRRWRVVLAVLIVIVVLGAAVALVVAFGDV